MSTERNIITKIICLTMVQETFQKRIEEFKKMIKFLFFNFEIGVNYQEKC